MTKYVLLMRHAKHEAAGSGASAQRKLSEEGEKETREAAETLASVIEELKDDDKLAISIGAIWRAQSAEVVATSEVMKDALGKLVDWTP